MTTTLACLVFGAFLQGTAQDPQKQPPKEPAKAGTPKAGAPKADTPKAGAPKAGTPKAAQQDGPQKPPDPGAATPAKPGPEGAKAAGSGNGDDTAQHQRTPWGAFRAAIGTRLAADQKRLKNLLDTNYLSDLALNYRDPDNRAYLDRKIDELSKSDPDIGGLLVAMLDPGRGGAGLRHRADNARRILERMDLTPYVPRLQKMLVESSITARLRALNLLTGIRQPGLVPVLKKYLAETPEVHIPRVLSCVGRYGDAALAPALLPFLRRPAASQRLMALRALARLRAIAALEPATTAVVELGTTVAYGELLQLLSAVREKVGTKELPLFVAGTLRVLGKSAELGKVEVLTSLKLLASIEPAALASEKAGIEPILRKLLAHRYPAVQFAAANELNRHGDKSGIKHVLDERNAFVRKNRSVPYAYYQRARAHAAFGKVSDALRDVSKAIKLASGADPDMHFFAARLEVVRGNASGVLKHLKAADPTPVERAKFVKENPAVLDLAKRNRGLKKLLDGK